MFVQLAQFTKIKQVLNMKEILKKFSLVDYIIIILVICAVVFAFIHITSDDSSHIQKTAFDASTINKIPDTYFPNYMAGNVMKATVKGTNATNGEEVNINGTIKWVEDNGGTNIKVLIDSENKPYLLGLYKSIPEADIYIKTLSIETNGTKYENLVEFNVKPMNISSLNDLVSKIPNGTDYEISTEISTKTIDSTKMQEISNVLNSKDKRESIKCQDPGTNTKLKIIKSTNDNIKDANSVLGNFNGITKDITIRVYNCSDSQMNAIKNSIL